MCASALAGACSEPSETAGDSADSAAEPVEIGPLEDMVEWEGELTLEENEDVINVLITVSDDPEGGFVVTDMRESQVRLYDEEGRIRSFFGSRGVGPGEFESPRAGLRLPSSELLVADRAVRMALFDEEGDSLIQDDPTPFTVLQQATLFNDSTVLMASPAEPDRLSEQLHLWNVHSNEVVRSFFTPAISRSLQPYISMTAWSVADVRDGRVAAAFAVGDTVHIFTADGELEEKIPLPSRGFRPWRAPEEDLQGDRNAPLRWLSSFDLVSAVVWLPEGDFLVQYQTMDEAGDFMYRLLHMSRSGELLAEAVGTPKLLTVRKDARMLYFVHPESETPNRWAYASLR